MNIVVDNYMMTDVEASKRKCPFIKDRHGYSIRCDPACMSWIKARKEIVRENHSGAIDVITKESSERGYQKIKRRGPNGCQGYLYLEAQGFCLRLWSNAI